MVTVVQLVRASDCGSECRGFESLQSPKKKRNFSDDFPLFFIIYPLYRDSGFSSKNLGELGLKTLSLAHETETSKNRQGQSENCFSNVLAKRVWLHLLNVPL
jgi:hypothetical protein